MTGKTQPTEKEVEAEIENLALLVKDKIRNEHIEELKNQMRYKIIRDVWNAILFDSWMNVVVWAKPRMGKSTCKMRIAYAVYHDWEQVLDSIYFNLAGFRYKLKNGIPCKIMELKHRHNRIPLLIGDDVGSNMNKAKTQHEPVFDLIKGQFDTYATKFSCLFTSMNQPDELTRQLAQKYTHELYIPVRGTAKYDEVNWLQNYRSWQPLQDKDWQQSFDFSEVPPDVYARYDEQRMSLVDEMEVQIDDMIADTELERCLKHSNANDKKLYDLVFEKAVLTQHYVNASDNPEETREAIKRAKGRGILVSKLDGTAYKFELTDFGYQVVEALRLKEADPNQLKKEIKAND